MIDTIDENYQHLSTLERLKSGNTGIEQDNKKNRKKVQVRIDESCLPDIVFPNVREEVILQLIFSFYFKDEGVRWELVPFLENKKIQSKLVTTLLCIAKDPYSSNLLPGCTSKRAESYKE